MAGDRRPVIVRRVATFLRGSAGIPMGSHVLVAVSGGPDSTALAAVLAELAPAHGLRLTLAHLRHGLRAERDEAEDEAVVRSLGASLGVETHVQRLGLVAGANVEARARVARRRALRAIAARIGATYVALGHTLDDQAETLLLRLVRGAGRRGLGGMRARDGAIVRPLLEARRADVRWYLACRRLPATLDRSNAALRFTRNRVRRLLLPFLAAEFNPRIAETLASLAARLRDEDDVLEAEAGRHAAHLCVGDRLSCDVATLPPALARRVVRTWLGSVGISAPTAGDVERARRAAGQSARGAVTLAGPRRVLREGDHLVCRAGQAVPAPSFCEPLTPGGSVRGPSWRLEMSEPRPWDGDEDVRLGAEATLLDADALPGGLAVRSPRRGDRVRVPNVGTRKLQDVLVDRKIPRERRGSLAVLTAGEIVLWVPGVMRTSVARVSDRTRRVLEARLVSDDKPALPLTKRCGTFAVRGERTERGGIE